MASPLSLYTLQESRHPADLACEAGEDAWRVQEDELSLTFPAAALDLKSRREATPMPFSLEDAAPRGQPKRREQSPSFLDLADSWFFEDAQLHGGDCLDKRGLRPFDAALGDCCDDDHEDLLSGGSSFCDGELCDGDVASLSAGDGPATSDSANASLSYDSGSPPLPPLFLSQGAGTSPSKAEEFSFSAMLERNISVNSRASNASCVTAGNSCASGAPMQRNFSETSTWSMPPPQTPSQQQHPHHERSRVPSSPGQQENLSRLVLPTAFYSHSKTPQSGSFNRSSMSPPVEVPTSPSPPSTPAPSSPPSWHAAAPAAAQAPQPVSAVHVAPSQPPDAAWQLLLSLGHFIKDHPAVNAMLSDQEEALALLQDLPQVLALLAEHPESITEDPEVQDFLRDNPEAMAALQALVGPTAQDQGHEEPAPSAPSAASPSPALSCAPSSEVDDRCGEAHEWALGGSKRAWEEAENGAQPQKPLAAAQSPPQSPAEALLWPATPASKRLRLEVPSFDCAPEGTTPGPLSLGPSTMQLAHPEPRAQEQPGVEGALCLPLTPVQQPGQLLLWPEAEQPQQGPEGASPAARQPQRGGSNQGSPGSKKSKAGRTKKGAAAEAAPEEAATARLVLQPQAGGHYLQNMDGHQWRKNGKKNALVHGREGPEKASGGSEGAEVQTTKRTYFVCSKCHACNVESSGRGSKGAPEEDAQEGSPKGNGKRGVVKGARKHVQAIHEGLGLYLATYYGEHIHPIVPAPAPPAAENVMVWEAECSREVQREEIQKAVTAQLACQGSELEDIVAVVHGAVLAHVRSKPQ